MKINNDIEFLNRKLEVIKNDIGSKNNDIDSITSLRNNLNNARAKENIKNEIIKLNNLIAIFESLYSDFQLDLNNISVLLEGNKELVNNIKDNKNYEKVSEEIQKNNMLLNKVQQQFDELYLFLNKNNIEVMNNYSSIKNTDYIDINNLKELNDFKDTILNTLEEVSLKNTEFKSKIKEVDSVYLQNKNISISLGNIHNKFNTLEKVEQEKVEHEKVEQEKPDKIKATEEKQKVIQKFKEKELEKLKKRESRALMQGNIELTAAHFNVQALVLVQDERKTKKT